MPAAKNLRNNAMFWPYSALAICVFLAALGTSIANIALPTISGAFFAPFTEVRMVLISYLVSLIFTVIVAGRLGDMFEYKRMLIVGLAIYGIAAIICGIADSLSVLIWARAGQGVGAAFLTALRWQLLVRLQGRTELGGSWECWGPCQHLAPRLAHHLVEA